jgi:hypothetical protein
MPGVDFELLKRHISINDLLDVIVHERASAPRLPVQLPLQHVMTLAVVLFDSRSVRFGHQPS